VADCALGDAPYQLTSPSFGLRYWGATIADACEMTARACNYSYGPGSCTSAYFSTPTPADFDAVSQCHVIAFGSSYGATVVATGCTVPGASGGGSTGSTGSGSDTSVICSTSCTVTHVISTEITTPLFSLDASGGALIAGAILAVWAVGYGFRAAIRALNVDGVKNSESE
jgi:hypothetical protein